MELFATVASTGFASGINLYAVTLLLGLGERLGVGQVPDLLGHPIVLTVAGSLFGLEFVLVKIPYVDSVWDSIHTVIRPVGAGLLGAVVAGDVSTLGQLSAAGGSGVLALISHTAKASARGAINASPEPASNVVASLGEDLGVVGLLVLAVEYPVIAIVVVALLALVAIGVTIVAVRLLRRAGRRWRDRRSRRAREPAV